MPKENISTTDQGMLITLIKEQSTKIEFINATIDEVKSNGLISPSVEMEFINIGYNDLLQRIKSVSGPFIIDLLEKQLHQELIQLKKLNKALKG